METCIEILTSSVFIIGTAQIIASFILTLFTCAKPETSQNLPVKEQNPSEEPQVKKVAAKNENSANEMKLLKPREQPETAKQKQIREGKQSKNTDYPTMADVISDWTDGENVQKKN